MTTTIITEVAGITRTTMTTTERPRASRAVAGPGTLRLYLVALLAAAYFVAWWLLGIRAPARSDAPPITGTTPQTSATPAIATWFHDLPAAKRPFVDLPAGWHIADPTAPAVSARAVPVPVRVAPARARRIRTRSS